MKVDKHIYAWAYNLIKYGDIYLRLYRESDYTDKLFSSDRVDTAYNARTRLTESEIKENVNLNLHKVSDPYSYYVEAVSDPSTMFELTKFGKTFGFIETPNTAVNFSMGLGAMTDPTSQTANLGFTAYKMKANDVNIFQADDFVHASLEDSNSRFPETVNIFLDEDSYKSNSGGQTYTVRRGKSMLIDSYKI